MKHSEPKPAPTTYQVILWCEDCAAIGMEIHLWKTASRNGVAGSVPHNTPATVLDTAIDDGLKHYCVSAQGITGWVSELMIKQNTNGE